MAEQDLAEAQRRKIDAILDAARVGEGTRLLEIGTGWGELALRAAGRGANGHLDHPLLGAGGPGPAADRRRRAGDRVEIRLQDYRETQGTFDAIV